VSTIENEWKATSYACDLPDALLEEFGTAKHTHIRKHTGIEDAQDFC
jgi:hypothetical protein